MTTPMTTPMTTTRGFHDVVENAWKKNVLLVALLELTYDCNLDCAFCYNDRGLAGERLSFDEWVRVLDELEALGVLNVVLSGGEPMVHPRFFDIGQAARARGFVVRLKTNAHLLKPDVIERLQREVDPFVVEVSLHGATAATHDRQTRVPGSFARLQENLRAAQAAKLRVRINSTLTRFNEGEIAGMFALADALGFPLTFDPDVTPRDDGDTSPLALAASDGGLRALFVEQHRRAGGGALPVTRSDADCASGGDKHCGAGSSTICIDPVGNVYPCVQWRRRAGNVRETPLGALWREAPVLADIRAATVDVKRALAEHGEAAPLLGFCPGTAESRGGSPLLPYDAALRRAETALVVQGRLRVLP